MYWKSARQEAWGRTKTALLSRQRLLLSVFVPISSAAIAVVILRLAQAQWQFGALVTVASALLGYGFVVAISYILELITIPSERDAKQREALEEMEVELARLNRILAGPTAPLPPIAVQSNHLYHLLRVIVGLGHRELWLSEIFAFGKETFTYLPRPGQVDYPDALRELFKHDSRRGAILETAQRQYVDFYGKGFTEDIRFKIGGAIA